MDVSDIFYFFCSGEGKGESEALGGAVGFSLKVPGRGGGVWRGGGHPGMGVCLRGIWEFGGGGQFFFFFGAEIPTKGKGHQNRAPSLSEPRVFF